MIEVREYIDERGISPFGRWFDDLDATAATKVRTALARMDARPAPRQPSPQPSPAIGRGSTRPPLHTAQPPEEPSLSPPQEERSDAQPHRPTGLRDSCLRGNDGHG